MNPSEQLVMSKVEGGYCHSVSVEDLSLSEQYVAATLMRRGLLRRLPARGRWVERYTTTEAGSWAIGTFEVAA